MRVLLISPNREWVPDPVFPLGLAYVASSLINEGHEVKILDLLFSEDIEKDIEDAVEDLMPQVMGISIRNVDDVSYPKNHTYLSEYKLVISILRELTDSPIVLGGSGFTILPREFMRELKTEFGIVGEGEKAFPRLLRTLKNNKTLLTPLKVDSIDAIKPKREIFDVEAYYQYGGMLNIQTKRGCPFKCIYCTYPKIEGRRMRLRDPHRVVDELEDIVLETGVNHFFFVDSIFNYPIKHAAQICREIIRRRLEINWTCYCTPYSMTEEIIGLMLRAGCTGVEFGTDSLNDDSLEVLGKSFDFRKIKEVSGKCRKMGLKFCHFLFIGAPGDTKELVIENFERLDGLAPDAAVVMAGIRVFPGTGIEKILKGVSSVNKIGLEPVFYITPDVLKNIEQLTEEVLKRKNWAMPGFEINIHERLQRKLRESGMKGSLWEGLSEKIR